MKVTLRRRTRLSVAGLLLTLWILPQVPVFAADRIIPLTVVVKEDDGKTPIPTAHVNVYQANIRFSELLAKAPDYQEDTNAQGIRRFDIKVKDGEELKLSIEVGREDKKGDRHDLNYGKNYPPQILEQFFLKSKATEAAAETTAVKVRVLRFNDNKNNSAVEGAAVVVQAIGVSGRGTGQTNANGDATVVVARSTEYEVTASKELYGSANQRITIPTPQAELGPVELFLQRERGTELTITVTDDSNGSPVADATVILDGPDYLRGTTSGGAVKFTVKEPGTYSVRISQQYYQKLDAQLTIEPADTPANERKTEPFQLTLKAKKEENKDKIEVTVLAKEDKESNAKPLPGADVTVGRSTMGTDENGRVTLTGSYDVNQEVHVKAQKYKPQTKSVFLNKLGRYAAGNGQVTFTLEPLLSETDTVRIIVEVSDPLGAPVKGAGVGFRFPNGTRLGGGLTDDKGEVTFPAKDTPPHDPVAVRKGIEVVVQQPGYLEHISLISSYQLDKPSAQAYRYLLTLKKDWSELEKAIGALEGRVTAWNTEVQAAVSKARSVNLLSAQAIAGRMRADGILAEMKAAQKAFEAKLSGTNCTEAKALKDSIETAQREAKRKEEEMKRTLDEAIALAATCKSAADANNIMAKRESGVRLAGEMFTATKKAMEANQKLTRLAEAMKEAGPLKTQLEQKVAEIEKANTDGRKDATTAFADYEAANRASQALPQQRAALQAELDKLKATPDLTKFKSVLPAEISRRLETLTQLLSKKVAITVPDQKRVDAGNNELGRLEATRRDANGIVSSFTRAFCEVKAMDDVLEELNNRVFGATIELGAAGDLTARAQACAGARSPTPTPAAMPTSTPSPPPKASPSPSPTTSPSADEITVPDLKGYTDPSKMIAVATQVGLKPSLVASNEPPASDGAGVLVRQKPLANAKAKRGESLMIFLSQKKVTTAPSPTPTPIPAATPSPKATDDVTVPSIPAGATVAEAKATLTAAGLGVGFNAKGGNPDSKDLEFKTTGAVDPPAGSKVKRGATVTVSVYQKYEPKTSPTPTSAPSPRATAASGTMPDLIGKTLEQAVALLPAKMEILSDEIGDKPPTPEKALTIFSQTPAAGTTFDSKKPPIVKVKRYGSAQATTGEEKFDGTYVGSYKGADKGAVRFTVSGGVISISSPGSGSGHVSASGSASISGSGADGESSYSFTGTFAVGADGKATASGSWSGQQQGYKGSGTWSATRR